MDNQDFHKYRFLAKAAKKNHIEQLFTQRNIVGMGFGKRTVSNKITDEPAVVIYVMKKISKRFLPLSKLLPRKIYIGGDCINVDVVETGPINPLSFIGRERPVPSGISIGHFNITAGTLGCLVNDLTDNSLCILSNNHILADENAATIGDSIVQPGPADGGIVPADTIATLKRFVMINAAGNTVDGAIAQVTDRANVINEMKNRLMDVATPNHPAVGLLFAGSCNRTIMNPINNVLAQLNVEFLNGPGATAIADIGMNVEKVGRTTEYTSSTITEIDVTVTINYDFGPATFDNQITTAWLSDGGDSGSLICRGGAGGNEDHCSDGGCGSTQAARSLLGKDLRIDVATEKIFREKYLSATLTGRYLLDTYFSNEDYIVNRIITAKKENEDIRYLQYLYDKYAEGFRAMATNPDNNSEDRITRDHINEGKQALGRLEPYLINDEKEAVQQLFEVAQSFEGRTMKEILNMLDDKEIFNKVVKIVSNVSSLKKKDC